MWTLPAKKLLPCRDDVIARLEHIRTPIFLDRSCQVGDSTNGGCGADGTSHNASIRRFITWEMLACHFQSALVLFHLSVPCFGDMKKIGMLFPIVKRIIEYFIPLMECCPMSGWMLRHLNKCIIYNFIPCVPLVSCLSHFCLSW